MTRGTGTGSGRSDAAGSWLRYALLALAAGGAVLGLGWLPAGRRGGEPAQAALAIGVAISVVAAWLAAWPLVRLGRQRANAGGASIRAIGQATGLRFLAAVAGAVWAVSAGVRPLPLVVGLGCAYLAALAAETAYTLRRLAPPASPPPAGGGARGSAGEDSRPAR